MNRAITLLILGTGIISCNQNPYDVPMPTRCYAAIEGFTYDSISGERLPNMPLTEHDFSNDTSYYVLSFNSGECDSIYPYESDPVIHSRSGRYFTRQAIDRNTLIENDTISVDVPFIKSSVVKLVFLDTTGVTHHCMEYYDYPYNRLLGTFDSKLADTTRYWYVYPNRPSRVRWYTILGTISSGQISIPLSENSSPWNYTMYGDTTVTVALDDTLELHCFY